MKTEVKGIEAILSPPPTHMVGDGFKVHNFFPSLPIIGEYGMSPFFLLDYNSRWVLPPSGRPRGVGVHPHRGIETVTIAYHGRIAHHDSAGNSGIIGEGDVQWMTAGGAVLHKEYHEKEFSLKGGLFQMVQLWVNLPTKYKMTPAKYQAIENKDMPKHYFDDRISHIDLIAGEYMGKKGPAYTFSPVNLFNARLKKETAAEFEFPRVYNTGILVIEGEITVNGNTPVKADHFIYFDHKGEYFRIEAKSDSVVLIMSGEPLNEPVSAYGPFVMNTDEEIKQAYTDYYNGKFGYLED